MFDILTSFFKSDAHQQSSPQEGEYYTRSGSCHQCGHCCTNIYLVRGNEPIRTLAEFEEMKRYNSEYRYFTVIQDPAPETLGAKTSETPLERRGLRFHCSHLQADNSCGIYEKRPSFCRRYPTEQVLRMGGSLAENCGYRFQLKQTFSQILTGMLPEPSGDQLPDNKLPDIQLHERMHENRQTDGQA